ncbi:MAG: glyoxylate/hydroxypyruvate reductase A, partial [Hyphomicrobiales bacterium]
MSVMVLVDGWDATPWVNALEHELPGRLISSFPNIRDHDSVDYALVWSPKSGLLNEFPNLKAIFSLGAGVDHLLADKNLPNVPIARIVDPDLTSRMSEWIITQVLLHHRQILQYQAFQRGGQWKELSQPAACDVHVGIMGLGELGKDAADILLRLGFQVRGWSRSSKDVPNVSCFHGADGMDEFLAGTDILVCLLPLTPETVGLVDRSLLSKLRLNGALGGSVFINAGRGKIQVEQDICDALDDGTLIGASLDVFEVEPLPTDSALWDRSNVVITPHAAAVSNPTALSRLIARQILAFENNHPL